MSDSEFEVIDLSDSSACDYLENLFRDSDDYDDSRDHIIEDEMETMEDTVTFRNQLELSWSDGITLHFLLQVWKKLIQTAVLRRNLSAKRLWVRVKEATARLGKNPEMKKSKSISFEDFVEQLKKDELYMTCCQLKMNEESIQDLATAWTTDQEKDRSTSLPLPTTEATITTLSTIAGSSSKDVDADESLPCERDMEGCLDELVGATSGPQAIGEISQSICKRVSDALYTARSVGESGYNIVKLEIYPFRECASMEKTHWWKKAEFRCLFLTSSAVDPLQMQVNKVLQLAGKQLSKLKEKKKKTR